ncbi:MAG: 50S ribosomal protein L25 [Acidobacteriota bacterium]
MSELIVDVELRETPGKNANRRLRAAGQIPAVVYGGDIDPVSIQTDRRKFLALLKEAGSDHAVFQLQVPGTKKNRHVMIRALDVDPITRSIRHIDFLRVRMSEAVRVAVPVEVVGVAVGVKAEGGIVDFVTREITIECLPGDIPHHLEADVSELHIGQHLEAKDLELPKGVEVIPDDLGKVVVGVAQARVEEEVVEEEDDMLETVTAEPELVGGDKDEA